jgi:FkbM family methyltransferase
MSRKYTYQEFIDIDSSDTVVDVGAYVGGFTTVAATQAREVIACEPAPQTAQALRENVASLENVRVVQKAVYNDFGTFQLNLSEDPTDNSLIKVDSSPLDVTETVETTTIDRLVESLNIEVIDFLKLDGEGVEPEVMEGMKNSEVKKIAVDAGRERFGQESIDEVRSLLISNGFEVRVDSHMIFARQK